MKLYQQQILDILSLPVGTHTSVHIEMSYKRGCNSLFRIAILSCKIQFIYLQQFLLHFLQFIQIFISIIEKQNNVIIQLFRFFDQCTRVTLFYFVDYKDVPLVKSFFGGKLKVLHCSYKSYTSAKQKNDFSRNLMTFL